MAETTARSYSCKVKDSSISGTESSAATQTPQLGAQNVGEGTEQDQLERRAGSLEDPSLQKELATGISDVRRAKSDVGDTNIPDETLSTGGLSDGMGSDDGWIPPNDSEVSQELEEQDCPPRRKPRVTDEEPNCTIRKPPSNSCVTRSGIGARRDQTRMVEYHNRIYSRERS